MKMRIVQSTLALALGLLVSAESLAGPPPDPQGKRALDSALDFLSPAEAARLERVEPFLVIVEPIEAEATARNLFEACHEVSRFAAKLPEVTVPSEEQGRVSLRNEVLGPPGQRELAEAIERLRTVDKDDARKQAEDVARKLAIVGRDIDGLCKKIVAGKLEDPDVELLRGIYRERAKTVLRYQQLLSKVVEVGTIVADLVQALVAPQERTIANADEKLIKALAVDPTGQPKSFAGPRSLGTAATTAFEGLAEFVIDRAKEETLNYIRDTLVERICGSDVGVFIPKTCTILTELDSSMALSAIGQMLHAAVIEDLTLMPDRLLVLAWMRAPELAPPATIVRIGLPMLADANLHKDPLNYAASIHAMPQTDCERLSQGSNDDGQGDGRCAETLAYLRLASVLLRASTHNVDDGYTPNQLPFLALGVAFDSEQMLERLPASARVRLAGKPLGLQWTSGSDGPTTPRFSSKGLTTLDDLFGRSIELAAGLEKAIEELSKINPVTNQSTATPASIRAAGRSTLVGLTGLVQGLLELDPGQADPALHAAVANIGKLVALTEQIRSEGWGSSTLAMFDAVNKLHREIGVEQGPDLDPVFEQLRRYLPLFVEIANAKSSADVKAALEAAFPAGGYRLKYRQPAVSLNAFLGLYGGGVYLFGDRPELTGEIALFAPVGVEISSPVGRTRKSWHLGLLLAAIDLGAITTSKFLTSEVAGPPPPDAMGQQTGTVTTNEEPARFNIAGLLSPGAYVTIGVAESPFSFGLGASVNPFALQQIDRRYVDGEVDTQSQRYLPALRFGAFMAVDITIVAFGRRSRRGR